MSIREQSAAAGMPAVRYVDRLLVTLTQSAPSSIVIDERERLPECLPGECSPPESATSADVLERLRCVAGIGPEALEMSRGVISTEVAGHVYMVRAEFCREEGGRRCRLDCSETISPCQ